MNFQQLRYFLSIAKYKSFSRAAESMFLSQPALSKQIASLEKSLGFRLFRRHSQGLELTDKGQQLYKRLLPIVQQLDDVLTELAEPTEVRLGTLPSLAAYVLPGFVAAIPSVKFLMDIDYTGIDLVKKYTGGDLDAILVQSSHAPTVGKSIRLFHEPYVAVVPENHETAGQECVSFAELDGHPVILQQAPCDIRDDVLQGFHEASVTPNVTLEAPLNESLIGYAAAGLGVAFVPLTMARQMPIKGVRYVRLDDSFGRTIWLCAKSSIIIERFENVSETISLSVP